VPAGSILPELPCAATYSTRCQHAVTGTQQRSTHAHTRTVLHSAVVRTENLHTVCSAHTAHTAHSITSYLLKICQHLRASHHGHAPLHVPLQSDLGRSRTEQHPQERFQSYRVPHTACRMPHAACRMPHTACRIPHTAYSVPHTVYHWYRIPHRITSHTCAPDFP
jgi:hypothetical protein